MNNTTESNVAPLPRVTERQGQLSEAYTKMHPIVKGGQCDFCGVIDPNQPAEYQYKLCPHFRGMDLRCSYCDAAKNPEEVNGRSWLKIHDHPYEKDTYGRPTLVAVCDSFICSEKHLSRFKLAR